MPRFVAETTDLIPLTDSLTALLSLPYQILSEKFQASAFHLKQSVPKNFILNLWVSFNWLSSILGRLKLVALVILIWWVGVKVFCTCSSGGEGNMGITREACEGLHPLHGGSWNSIPAFQGLPSNQGWE